MQFSQDFPDELRLQIQTSEVVSKKVALKQKGKEYGGLCPFHNEKTPSFTVNNQKGFYHCFGCGQHGDIISFVMKTEGLNFKEAIFKLANDFNIPVPIVKAQNQENEEQNQLKKQYLILEKICEFFEKNLFDYAGQSALNYIQNRGLSVQNIKKFRLGFAPDNYNSLHSYLTKSGFNEKELLESGAVGKNQNGQLYDKFRNRLIFPILDKKDRVIAYGGRILGDGQPKYLNSSETPLFKKGSNLYNYSSARKSVYDQKFAVLVEGYMDVVSLAINGVENAVAPLGTAITQNQLLELFKITNDIVICLDGDAAGQNAMNRVIETALPIIKFNKILRFVILPGNLDPDDFIRQNGQKSFQNLLINAKNLSETLFQFESKKLGILDLESKIAPEKKAALENILMEKTALITDANSKKYFTQYYKNLLFEIGKIQINYTKKTTTKPPSILHEKLDPEFLYEQSILALLIQEPKLIDYQDSYCNIRQLDFGDESLSNIKESLIDFIDKKNDYNSHDLSDFLDNLLIDPEIKAKVLRKSKSPISNEVKLKILALKHHHCQVSKQYKEILSKIDDFDTSNSSISGRQKELFDHKTELERAILELESNIT